MLKVIVNIISRPARLRPAAMLVHRCVGLVIAVFLSVAGLSGCLLAFYAELDAALNPELFQVAPPALAAPLLDPIELRDRIRLQLPKSAVIDGVILHLKPDRSVNYWIDERETFADPYTGKVLGSRKFGDLGEGKQNLLTFIYRLHYSLALDELGVWLLGVVALLWTLDCFAGAYLTFPPRTAHRNKPRTRAWISRWLPAWLIKANTLFGLVFTWHRASGLWVWGCLLVFAWSAVALNLGEQVYSPVMRLVVGDPERAEVPLLAEPRSSPHLDTRAALALGRRLIADQAKRLHFAVLSERALSYDAERGSYSYTIESSLDVGARLADTTLEFDGDDGRLLAFHDPRANVRSVIDQWLIALHFGAVRAGGVAYRVFVCVFGLVVALLSLTGVWIWLRKRGKRSVR